MEETCARLREEIEILKNENKTLENIYLANGISRISKNNDEDQLSKWVNETLENITSTEPYVEDSRTVYLLSKTLNWSLDSCFCSTKLLGENDDKSFEKSWQTKWTHKIYQNQSTVKMEFTVINDCGNERITNLSIELEGLSNSSEELKPLIEKSIEICDPSLFFTQFENYLGMHTQRNQYLEEINLTAQFHKKTGYCRIVFNDAKSLEPLVRVQWMIVFNKINDEFEESYQAAFTGKGQEMAQEYNFPEEIIAHGFFDNWNVIECIKNMNKLVLISNETPVKKRRN